MLSPVTWEAQSQQGRSGKHSLLLQKRRRNGNKQHSMGMRGSLKPEVRQKAGLYGTSKTISLREAAVYFFYCQVCWGVGSHSLRNVVCDLAGLDGYFPVL